MSDHYSPETSSTDATPRLSRLQRVLETPVVFAAVILFLAASRWGSYLHIPGVRFYIGDALVALGVLQVVLLRRAGRLVIRRPDRTTLPVVYLLAGFFAWAVLRFFTRTSIPIVALRDMAPYMYAITALLAYLHPVRDRTRTRLGIYSALVFHALWYVGASHSLLTAAPTVNVEAPIFSTRPDFDAAVFAIAIGLALRQMLVERTGRRPSLTVALIAFLAVNVYALTSQHSRSGLVASIVTIVVVVGAWLRSQPEDFEQPPAQAHWAARGGVVFAAILSAILALLFTLPGQRLIDGLDGTAGSAGGTQHARVLVLDGISHWLFHSPLFAVFGVGYGPNILTRSGTLDYLEGSVYENVRSPHNYLLGTWARLGIPGVLLAAALLIAAGLMAVRRLRGATAPADTLAALILLSIPVVALLGVVLESPFGAIPYFWAIGQLLATTRERSKREAADPATELAGAQR